MTVSWTRQLKNQAQRLAERLLQGVGEAPVEHVLYPLAHHHKRCLTDAEMAAIGPDWCAIPAQDEAGTPERVLAQFVRLGFLRPDGRRA